MFTIAIHDLRATGLHFHRNAPGFLQLAEPLIGEFWREVRVCESTVRPEVAADVGEVPPADRFEFRLAVDQRVNRFEPVGLRRFAPRTVPPRRGGFWSHAA